MNLYFEKQKRMENYRIGLLRKVLIYSDLEQQTLKDHFGEPKTTYRFPWPEFDFYVQFLDTFYAIP